MQMFQLAILIPAYKVDYLSQVFDCLVNQTCKDFNLYVFDDNSPFPIKEVYDKYFVSWENAKYHRFETNLGGKDIAAQWQRCVDNIGNEEWVWLFSDDDLMSEECVEEFYKSINDPNAIIDDVVHFNLCQIDGDSIVERIMHPYPQNISVIEYYDLIHTGKIETRMPEFIFRHEKIHQAGGYVSFDLAWRSDNASVTNFTYPGTIYTVPKGIVSWRLSNKNVTGSNVNLIGNERKRKSDVAFHNWNYLFFKNNNLKSSLTKTQSYDVFFCLTGKSWRYNVYWSDLRRIMKELIALQSYKERLKFFIYWLNMQLANTQRRYWPYRIFYIFSR